MNLTRAQREVLERMANGWRLLWRWSRRVRPGWRIYARHSTRRVSVSGQTVLSLRKRGLVDVYAVYGVITPAGRKALKEGK